MPKGQYVRGRPLPVRFWSFVTFTPECWEWTGYITPKGYGTFCLRAGVTVWAHRLAYELTHGPFPAGLTIDHLCNNRGCVRPSHLEPVTQAENVRRGWARRQAVAS